MIGRFNCGCVSLIGGFDAVLILPCHGHREQVGTTVMRDNHAVDATADESRAAMAEMHSAMKDAHEHRKAKTRAAEKTVSHWWLTYRGAKIDFTGDQFGGPEILVEIPPSREADAARRVGEKIRSRLSNPAGNCFDCSVAAGILLAAEGVPVRLCRGTVGADGQYHQESIGAEHNGVDFESLAGFLGLHG